jgi:hypothetical protein
MKLAKDFLSRFQSLTPPDDAVKNAVAKIVHNISGVPAAKKDITLARGVAFVNCSSVAKSAIRAQRGEILKELYLELPKARETVRDIR